MARQNFHQIQLQILTSKSQTQQRDLVNFGIGGAAKFICWNVFVLTSFQILCTKLVEPSFVFPNYFADF